MNTTRRDFLKLGGLGAAALASGSILAGSNSAFAATEATGRPLRMLILGGTGFTGPHQVRYALERGHQVTLFNRGRRSIDWPAAVEELTGDRDSGDLDALRDRQWDVCIDNPTSVPAWVRDAGEVLAGNIGHYVFISTLSVLAETSRPGQAEDAPLAEYTGADAMQETMASLRADMRLFGPLKAACEAEAERRFPGISTIIRPGLIIGPGDATDRFTYWPVRLARGGEVLAPGDGSDPVQIIDARDLAEWTIRMAERRAFGIFNAPGPDYELSMEAMLYGIRAVTTNGARLTWVPAEFLGRHDVRPWADMPTWLPGTGDTAGFSRVSNARAVAAGLTFRALATTAADTLEWFRSEPAERRAELRAGLSAEREKAVLSAWHARG
ncbi:MAG TPA: twin-arginine translocation signal domain-containing protein [Gammaproteobacteria bacterium]|nr:twin-arginine translocation signal domain-containing protein [Gammaproteobacteria bacterium]